MDHLNDTDSGPKFGQHPAGWPTAIAMLVRCGGWVGPSPSSTWLRVGSCLAAALGRGLL